MSFKNYLYMYIHITYMSNTYITLNIFYIYINYITYILDTYIILHTYYMHILHT